MYSNIFYCTKKRLLLTSIYCLFSPPHSLGMNCFHLLYLCISSTTLLPPSPHHPHPGSSNSDWSRSNFCCQIQWALFGPYSVWQTWHQWLLPPSRNIFCPEFLTPSLSFPPAPQFPQPVSLLQTIPKMVLKILSCLVLSFLTLHPLCSIPTTVLILVTIHLTIAPTTTSPAQISIWRSRSMYANAL